MKLELSIITFESLIVMAPPRLSVAWLRLKLEPVICAVVFLRYAAPAIGDVLLVKTQFFMMLFFPLRSAIAPPLFTAKLFLNVQSMILVLDTCESIAAPSAQPSHPYNALLFVKVQLIILESSASCERNMHVPLSPVLFVNSQSSTYILPKLMIPEPSF